MTLKEKIALILKENNIKPVKYRGQNFLISSKILEEIVSYAKVKKGDMVLEIGPGVGNLTKEILASGANVIAVEKDENLAKILKNRLKNSNLTIINKSVLDFNEESIKPPYKIVANIPYYLTGPILRKFLLGQNIPSLLVLTIQKEVGDRIIAKLPKSNFLSQMVSLLAHVEIKKIIGPENFWPQPKIDSSIVLIKPKEKVNLKETEKLIKFIKTGFKQPRKTLANNLFSAWPKKKEGIKKTLEDLKLKENIRAHELTQKQWEELFKKIMG